THIVDETAGPAARVCGATGACRVRRVFADAPGWLPKNRTRNRRKYVSLTHVPLVPTGFHLALLPVSVLERRFTPLTVVDPGFSTCANSLMPTPLTLTDAHPHSFPDHKDSQTTDTRNTLTSSALALNSLFKRIVK